MKIVNDELSPSKLIAYSAVMCALLIGGQLALSYVAGIEIVTLLLLTFAYCFGVRCGVLTAVSFSLLRCCIWGFYPSVVLLYLIYYPLFALLFGLLGKVKDSVYDKAPIWLLIVVNVFLIAVACAGFVCIKLDLIKISRLYKTTITVLLWVVSALCIALDVAFNVIFLLVKGGKLKNGTPLKLFFITTLAAVCTICFTLIDDLINFFIYGFNAEAAIVYFYSSFMAMLPQTICTIVTVATLHLPLCSVLKRVK
jgi:hypothetical protein